MASTFGTDMMQSVRRLALLGFVLLACVSASHVAGQDGPALYVAVLATEDFQHVGAANAGTSGLHRYDGGEQWSHFGWPNTRSFGVAAVPMDPETIFLAAGNGIFRTQDGGQTWRITSGWEITEVLDVAVDPNAPQNVYAATAYGVWHSPDQGETWRNAVTGIPEPEATFTQTVAVDRRKAGHLVVGGEEGLFRSTDGARAWQPVGPRGVPVRDVKQSAADPSVWLAATDSYGVLVSRDDGETWKTAGTWPDDIGALYAVAPDPANVDRMATAGYDTGVYVSTDGGTTWRLSEGLSESDVHALAFDARRPERLWAGTMGDGVFYSDDLGETWTHAGLDGALVWDMDFIGR